MCKFFLWILINYGVIKVSRFLLRTVALRPTSVLSKKHDSDWSVRAALSLSGLDYLARCIYLVCSLSGDIILPLH